MTEVIIKNAGVFHAIAQCVENPKTGGRPYIQNVLIEKSVHGYARLVATDGHVIACAPVEAEWATDGPVAVLPTAELMRATRPMKGHVRRLIITDTTYGVQDVASGATSSFPRVHNKCGPADFPDWYPLIHNRIESTDTSVAYAGGFAIGEIERVAKIGKLLNTAGALAYPSMIFAAKHGYSPCRIVYGNFDAILYLVPFRDHADPSRRDANITWLSGSG